MFQDKNIVTGGSSSRYKSEYSYIPSANATAGSGSGWQKAHDSKTFAPGQDTIKIGGGVSDKVQYNRTLEAAAEKTKPTPNVKVGDTLLSTDSKNQVLDSIPGFVPGSSFYSSIATEKPGSVGNDTLGATGTFRSGIMGNANAGYEVGKDSVTVKASGSATAGVKVDGEAHLNTGIVNLGAKGEATAGATVSGNASVTADLKNGVTAEVGGKAFVGVEAKASAEAELGNTAKVGAGIAGQAGVGVEAKADIELNLDNVGVDLALGASLGLGAKVEVDLSISPKGAVQDAITVGRTTGKLAVDAYDYASDKVSAAADTVSTAANDAYDYTSGKISDASDAIGEAANDAYDYTADKVSDVADAAGDAYNYTTDKVSDVADTAKEAANDIGDMANDAYESVKNRLGF